MGVDAFLNPLRVFNLTAVEEHVQLIITVLLRSGGRAVITLLVAIG